MFSKPFYYIFKTKDHSFNKDKILEAIGQFGPIPLRANNDPQTYISSSDWARILVNNSRLTQSYQHDTSELKVVYCSASGFVKRGDYIQIHGAARGGDEETCRFEITKLEK